MEPSADSEQTYEDWNRLQDEDIRTLFNISSVLPQWGPSTSDAAFGFRNPWWVVDVPDYKRSRPQNLAGYEEAASFFRVN